MTHPDMDITLDGVHFKLRGPLAYTNLATLPPKLVVGDYTLDTNELMSAWVISDLSGGHGVADLKPSDSQRYRWAQGISTRFPQQWAMPYRVVWDDNSSTGQYQPLCDGLTTLGAGNTDYDWRQFALYGRTMYVDDVIQTGLTGTARSVNKGVAFKGLGSSTGIYIPHGDNGWGLYVPGKDTFYTLSGPNFIGFCQFDNKVIGVDTDGLLWKSIRTSVPWTGTIGSGSGNVTINVDAASTLFGKNSYVFIGSHQFIVVSTTKTTVTLNRSTTGAISPTNNPIWGQFAFYDGKPRIPTGYDVKEVIVYQDQSGQPVPFIVTDRDVWAFDEAGPRVYRTQFTFPQGPYTGIGATVWRGDLYVAGGMDLYRYNGDATQNIGLSRDDGLPLDYQGYIADLTAGPNGLYALVQGRTDVAAKKNYWSVQEWTGTGWSTVWADAMAWQERTLNGALGGAASDTTVTLNSASNIEPGDLLRIGSEILLVKSRNSGTQLTVRRGALRTSRSSYADNTKVYRQRDCTFIQFSLADPTKMRLNWGVGDVRFYQDLPAEATNPREHVENNVGFSFGYQQLDNTVDTTAAGLTYQLQTGRFDGQMPGYAKLANAVELRLRRLPPEQVLRLYYRLDSADTTAAWTLLGVVAGGHQTTLGAGINNSTTTIPVASSKFVKVGMYLKIDNEWLKVTAVPSTTEITATRAQRSTSAASHSNGATVYVDLMIGSVESGRNIFRFGSYAANQNVFTGTPFHAIELKVEVKNQRGPLKSTALLASQLTSGVVSGTNQAEDDDLFASGPNNGAPPVANTFVIEHLALSYLKLRAPSGSWIADLDLSTSWMDQSPEALTDKLDSLLTTQKFIAFKHRDATYRVRVAQITGSDQLGEDERAVRRINLIEMPITLGPLGEW